MIPKFRAWFPAPCGVNRLFYKKYGTYRYTCSWSISGPSRGRQVAIHTVTNYTPEPPKPFPAPNEEDRELYGSFDADFYIEVERFPAPRGANRLFYTKYGIYRYTCTWCVSGPSRGRQVAIHTVTNYTPEPPKPFPTPREVDRFLYRKKQIQT